MSPFTRVFFGAAIVLFLQNSMTAARDLVREPSGYLFEAHCAKVLAAPRTYGHCVRFELPIADNQHVGNPL